MERTLVGKRGALTVTMTDTEALQQLAKMAAKNKFAGELCAKAPRGLSQEQMWWVHKLVQDSAQPMRSAQIGDMAGIIGLFQNAQQHLKRPVVRLAIGTGDDALRVRLSVASEHASVPGSLTVATDENYESRRWLGRIHTDGRFEVAHAIKGDSLVAQLTDLLQRFAAEPAKVAAEFGAMTGACCFCGRLLTDEGSIEVGYGPKCADHYDLPHTPKGSKAVVEMQY